MSVCNYVTFRMSHVTLLMSDVTLRISHVMCQMLMLILGSFCRGGLESSLLNYSLHLQATVQWGEKGTECITGILKTTYSTVYLCLFVLLFYFTFIV